MKIYSDIKELIGNTPLFRPALYNERHAGGANILCKLEYLNPAGSTKDRAALYMIEDAEVVIAACGVSARIAKSAVDICRAAGKKVGLIRPITVHPFPYKAFDHINYDVCKAVLDVEMSIPAQLVQDVNSAVLGRCPIETCLCSGGNIMSREAILKAIDAILAK